MFHPHRSILFATIVLLTASFARADLTASNDDTPATRLQHAPAAVQAAVKVVVGAADVEEFARRNIDGRIVYEVGYLAHGVPTATQISDAGEVLRRATDVDPTCLPGEILDAARDSEANGKVLSAALVITHGGDPFYELDVRVGSLKMLMKIAADGSVISEAIEGAAPRTPTSGSHG
jgi:hypothetical protein